jgi:hypothetical protein
LIAKTTHTTATMMSIHHSSSAYSFACVIPRGSVIAAQRMMSCQPHMLMLDSKSLAMRVLQSRWVE